MPNVKELMEDVVDAETQLAANRNHRERCDAWLADQPEWWTEQRTLDAEEYEALIEFIPQDKRGKCLELGCGGRGHFGLLLKAGFAPLNGIELLPELVGDDGAVFCMAMEDLAQFQAGIFKTVVSFQVLEHTRNVDKTLQGIHHVLRPGGYTAHVVPSETHRESVEPAHLTNLGMATWTGLFEENGFEKVYTGFYVGARRRDLFLVFRKAGM